MDFMEYKYTLRRFYRNIFKFPIAFSSFSSRNFHCWSLTVSRGERELCFLVQIHNHASLLSN